MLQITKIQNTYTFLILTLFSIFLQCTSFNPTQKPIIYHMVSDYDDYVNKFKANAGIENTIQMTEYGTGKQICKNGKVCRFYVYLYEPQNKSQIKYTVMFNSGMHGNQLIGPTSLLYAYPLLKPSNLRIIYFPIFNPSGYTLKQRYSYPENLDLNRDYPIDNNFNCYKASATRIVDHLYRKYKIDLTLNLHNGADQIGYNWGTKFHFKMSHTDDYPIYQPITQMLKFYGGHNERLKILPFKIGTMNQVVYPAQGTLDDWAYGASWAQSVPAKCNNYSYEPYPITMHNGLVFLFELGMHSAPQGTLGTSESLNQQSTSKKNSNGYVTRALRMFRQILKVMDPTFTATIDISANKLMGKIQGCNKIKKILISITDSNNKILVKSKNYNIQNFKHIQHSFSYLFEIDTQSIQGKLITKQLQIHYDFRCDQQWEGKGKSVLSKPRIFKGIYSIKNNRHKQIKNNDQIKQNNIQSKQIVKNMEAKHPQNLLIKSQEIKLIQKEHQKLPQIKQFMKVNGRQVNNGQMQLVYFLIGLALFFSLILLYVCLKKRLNIQKMRTMSIKKKGNQSQIIEFNKLTTQSVQEIHTPVQYAEQEINEGKSFQSI